MDSHAELDDLPNLPSPLAVDLLALPNHHAPLAVDLLALPNLTVDEDELLDNLSDSSDDHCSLSDYDDPLEILGIKP